VPRDILKEAPAQAVTKFNDDAGDVWPEVSRIVLAFSLSRLGKRLAWVSCKQGVDLSPPRAGIESLEVIPDRGRVQVSGALPVDEGAAGVFFDFDIAGGGKARLGKLKTHVKSAAACAEGEAVSGR
jgi:hypothetical protein